MVDAAKKYAETDKKKKVIAFVLCCCIKCIICVCVYVVLIRS